MEGQQKLELTGLARTRRLRFQLRILLKNRVCHYHAKQRVMGATVRMYGDLQEIEGLELGAIGPGADMTNALIKS